MIKKYIGITLVTASLAIVGCSSSDDDATDMADTGMTDAGAADAGAADAGAADAGAADAGAADAGAADAGAADAGAADAGAADAGAADAGAADAGMADAGAADAGAADAGMTDGGDTGGGDGDGGELTRNPGSTTDVVWQDNRARVALEALRVVGFTGSINGSADWTVFLPSDAALEAAGVTPDALNNDVFQRHIHTVVSIPAEQLLALPELTMNDGTVYMITGGSDATTDPAMIGGVEIIGTDLMSTTGSTAIVHILDGVLP